MTSIAIRGTGSEVAERQTLLIEYDAKAISEGVDVAIAARWAYSLPNRVDGVTARGVEEGLRLLSSHGEIIRVDECILTNQDDREAFFMATASRYVLGGDGTEIKLDSQKRGKRVPKWEPKADGTGEFFVKAWYEIGVVKASRNAALALMPSNVKTALLRAGLDAAAQEKRGGGNQQATQPAAPQQRQATQAAPKNLEDFWKEVDKRAINRAGLTAESMRRFKKAPNDATDAQRTLLLKVMSGESDGPPQTGPAACLHMPKTDLDGVTVCETCGLILDDGKPSEEQGSE